MTFTNTLYRSFIHLLSHNVLQKGYYKEQTNDDHCRRNFRVFYVVMLIVAILMIVFRLSGILQMKIILESAFLISQYFVSLIDHP